MLKVDKRKKNVYDQLVQPYTAGTAVSVSIKGIWESVQTTQHCTASTPTGRPYMQGAGGAHNHVVFAWAIEKLAISGSLALTVNDKLNLLADRSSLFIPMAEGGGCYGCLTLCNAIIFCVVHARGPVDPWP